MKDVAPPPSSANSCRSATRIAYPRRSRRAISSGIASPLTSLYAMPHEKLIMDEEEKRRHKKFSCDFVLGVQLCFRRFPIDDFSGKWWSK